MSDHEQRERAQSNYERYWAAPFNRPEHYPLGQEPDPRRYRPLGAWLGRLALPSPAERAAVLGAWIELQRAPAEHGELVGRRVRLRWTPSLDHNARFWGATRSVHFNAEADEEADPVDGGGPILFVTREPAQVTGRFYGLVTFLGPADAEDGYLVRHYEREAGAFSGPEELVRLPEVLPDDIGTRNGTAAGIERSPLNGEGWYIYGALDAQGRFVVQALAPRRLLRLIPQRYCDRTGECME
jgi:predicted Abi (CAAX) family protease